MKTKSPHYHVGLLARGRTAVMQYRRSVDYLSCEILHYFGVREITKADAKRALQALRANVLRELNQRFPGRNFNRVTID